MMVRSLIVSLVLVCGIASLGLSAAAETAPIYTQRHSDVAVGGYDAVAYFTLGTPVEGDEAFATEYQGVRFLFANQTHLELFLAAPEDYAPQYGGYCAWAAARGKRAAGKPEHWAIVDGRLYLNYSRRIQRKWDKDREGFIRSADERWPSVIEAE